MPVTRIRWLLLGICLLSFSPIAAHAQTPTSQAVDEPENTPAEAAATAQRDPREKPVQILSGRIIDADTGEPINGAGVAVASGEYAHISKNGNTLEAYAEEKRILLFFTPKNAKRSGQARTDTEGRFSITNLARGTYHVAVIHPGYMCELIDEIKFTADASPVEIKLTKTEPIKTCTVAGHVKDANGLPIAQTFVGVVGIDGGTVMWHRGETALSEGDMWIYRSMESYMEEDAHDWFSEGNEDSEFHTAARTDENGVFEIHGLRPGTYNLAAAHKYKGIKLMERLEVTPQMKPLELILQPETEQKTHTLTGRVVNEEGKPLGHISIAIASTDGGSIFGSDGNFFGSTDAPFSLWAHAEDPYNTDYLWFSSEGGASNAATGMTNADGAFSFKNMLPGTYHLAAAQSSTRILLIDEVKLDADSAPLELVMKESEAPSTTTFKGRVVDHEGKPVSDARVGIAEAKHGQLYWEGENYLGQDDVSAFYWNPEGKEEHDWFTSTGNQGLAGMARTNDKGEFAIEDMLPGDYKLLVVHTTAGATLLKGISFQKDGEPVQVTLGKPTFVEGAIAGLSPVSDTLYLHIAPSIGIPQEVRYSVSIQPNAQTGRFRAGPLLDTQDWVLRGREYVRAKGYTALRLSTPFTVTPGTTAELNVDLSKGEVVSGQVLGPKGEPLSGVSIVLHTPPKAAASRPNEEVDEEFQEIPPDAWAYGAITDSFGTYTIKGVPEGDYVLRAKRHAKRTAPG